VVDAQMEILAQCMEACQALFMLEEKQNYWMGQMRKREKGQEWPFLWLWWSSSLRAPLGERRNDKMLVCKLETLSALTKLWKGRGKKKRKEEEEDSNMCCTELDRKLDDSLGMETAYSQWAVWC
jgi:hypothetical protein